MVSGQNMVEWPDGGRQPLPWADLEWRSVEGQEGSGSEDCG